MSMDAEGQAQLVQELTEAFAADAASVADVTRIVELLRSSASPGGSAPRQDIWRRIAERLDMPV